MVEESSVNEIVEISRTGNMISSIMIYCCRPHADTIARLHDRGAYVSLKSLLSKNSGINNECKSRMIISENSFSQSHSVGWEKNYQPPKDVYEIVDGVLNLLVVTHQIRGQYSYEGLSLFMALHKVSPIKYVLHLHITRI